MTPIKRTTYPLSALEIAFTSDRASPGALPDITCSVDYTRYWNYISLSVRRSMGSHVIKMQSFCQLCLSAFNSRRYRDG